jgi:hypothetical protein
MRKKGAMRRRIALAIVAAMLASIVVVPMPAAAAAGSFTGGPDQWPVYVANDHTPIAVHFTADGSTVPTLAASTSYYLKVRFTVGAAPSGSTNRGYTWNPVSQRWVQEREDWTQFPIVTTDANGSISSSAGWVFVKFGDDTKSGPYHLMISLSATGNAATFNGTFAPVVTVFDPRADGSWVHNGVAVASNKANKNVRLTDEASATVLSLQKSELQGVDDDANGVVDDEDYGPVGNVGDFRMSTPTTFTVKVNLNQAFWPSTSSTFTPGPADTDIALGASESVAPSAVSHAQGASGDGHVEVSWSPASDNVGVAGYYVYRWTPAPVGAAYSPVHTRVATLGPDAVAYDDDTVVNGQTYLYEVRAFDAATNVGPRSGLVTVTPQLAAPRADVVPADPDGLDGWYVTAPVVTLRTPPAGHTNMYSFEDTATSGFTTYTVPVTVPEGIQRLYYFDTDGSTISEVQQLDFKVDTLAPTALVSAPLFSTMLSTSRTYPIAWSGTDAGSGVAVYDVEYKTGVAGAWTAWRASTATTSSAFTGTAGATYYFRVRSVDVAGNESPWVVSNSSKVPYDQTKASFSHGWSTLTSASRYLGSAKYTTASGAYANFTLSKGVLYVVVTTGPKNGKFAVYYRGRKVATIDTYSKTTKYRQTFQVATYAKGTKASAVKIVNLGTRNRPRIEIDGFALRW